MSQTQTYKGYKIMEVSPEESLAPTSYFVYTAEEWAQPVTWRSYEWEAVSEVEARDYVDCRIAHESGEESWHSRRYTRIYV